MQQKGRPRLPSTVPPEDRYPHHSYLAFVKERAEFTFTHLKKKKVKMSNRRKRAPPVKVDEEKQQQLRWNMHEDRRNEPVTLTDDEHPCTASESSSAQCIIIDDSLKEEVAHRDKKRCSESVCISKSINKEEIGDSFSPLSVKLNIVISPCHFDNSWKALLGEFTLQLLPEQSLIENFSERSFTLVSSESSSQFLIYVHSECIDVEKQEKGLNKPSSVCDKGTRVESSFSGEMLEDLGWLQKKRRIKLYHKPDGNHIIKVGIYLLEDGLAKLDFLSDANSRMKKFNQLMKKVMEKLYNFIIPDVLEEDEEDSESEPEGQDIDELYHFVKQTHQQETQSIQVDVQHPALTPVLRPYQREAVNWMLQQEHFRSTPVSENALHFLWREIVTSEGLKLYYNPYTGCIIREYPSAGPQLFGGILADEMGLGKTVEVLALILTHIRQDVKQDALTLPEGKVVNYFIPSHSGGQVKNTETQIMEIEPKEKVQCPPTRVMILTAVKEMNGKKGVSILSIYKYVSSIYRYDVHRNKSLLKRMLKCLIFEGLVKQIKGHGFSGTFTLGKNYKEEDIYDKTKKQVYQGVKKDGFLQPHFLAEQDIVIITYDVLRSELNYVDIPHSNSEDGRRLRNQKRYMAIPSPLVAVEWWRICLDEAQMVECPAVKAAEMAQRLSGINRWCISGTPVQRGLEDLFGLVVFLGVEPFCVKHWWVRLLYHPYCRKNPQPLYSFIAKILWRSAKKDVIDQIQIPPQTEETHWLHFSPVERHFYHRQHEVCCQDAVVKLRKISDWALKLSSLDRRTVTSILYPLLRLRQACCHPQAVRGEFLPLQKSTMTMEELLTSLQKKCGTECEEAHRQLVCALNGLAGIHIIKGEYALAAELYREVLRSSEEHKGKLKTDSLQRLHATHNLMELLADKHPGIPPTLRDGRLEEEARQLREHYMSKCNTEVAEAQQALLPVQQTIRELQRKIYSNSPWWLNVIHRAVEFSIDEELVQRVRNEITSNYKQQTSKLSMSEKFRDCRGLQFLLTTQMEELNKFQKLVREAVKNLEGPPSRNVIESATICHLRPIRLPLNCCVFCKADELFTEYESKLFSHTVKGQTAIFEEMIEDEEGLVDDRAPTTNRGLWAISETERSMKALLSFAKSHRFDIEFIDEGSTSMDLFEAWKKEYKLLHEYWMALRNRVSAVDELAMATERLRIRHPREPKPNPPVLHIIEPHEVEQNRIKLLNDKTVATSQLQKKLGQLLYLNNLEKSQDKTSGGINPEPCPICARQLGKQWAVLTCGHCFCNECVSIIIEQYSVGSHRSSIKCAICRQNTSHKEISYVFTSEKASQEEDIPVKGSHSTKVEAVVRTLMRIQLRDPEAKALVFSTWQDVLDIISKALTDNNMEFAQISRVKTFQENLSAFKHDPQINILLLPLHTGSNGLTIIEATHVLLVEPILNPAHELQAIGRVHRIGQTKPTIVHRFLIKATIEERMQAMLKTAERSHTSSSAKHPEASVLTVADLADLFTKDTEELE
ncbi:E3 ubiquitin-protein ligase SHPRH isoform X3 [Myotis lucifugus]|uniref:E3 ubiquitin-protein ligase SHPRH isoform X3 n=1 Tax=Myotis lucifugus TaxID=59463 RepID=UPI000CCC3300|nr:E3 ubiquitin-protein ligase SHPRH isoform X3 [Myotis lucifugus]